MSSEFFDANDQNHNVPNHNFTDVRDVLRAIIHEGGQIHQSQGLLYLPPSWPPEYAKAVVDKWGDDARHVLKNDPVFLQTLILECTSVDEAGNLLVRDIKRIKERLNTGSLGGIRIGTTWWVSKTDILRNRCGPMIYDMLRQIEYNPITILQDYDEYVRQLTEAVINSSPCTPMSQNTATEWA